jgi:hypothetical protein
MTMQINIKEQFLDKFEAFVNSLPKNAIEINNIDDNGISLEQAKDKVSRSINDLSLHKGVDIDKAFEEACKY